MGTIISRSIRNKEQSIVYDSPVDPVAEQHSNPDAESLNKVSVLLIIYK